MRAVLLVTGLMADGLHDCEVDVVANQVSGVKRAGLHAGAQLHCAVNVFRRSDAVCNNTHCFVHHRDEHAVYNEARTLVDGNRGLAEALHQLESGGEGLFRGLHCMNNLNQLHDLRRVEEVAADEAGCTMRNSGSHFGDRHSRSVGCEDRMRRADVVQLTEQVLLQIHALQNNLHDEVSIGSGLAVGRGLELGKKLILAALLHLALLDQEVEVACDTRYTTLKELILYVDQGNVVIVSHKDLSDARAHVAGAEYTNIHVTILPISNSIS